MGAEDREILLRHSLWSFVANDGFLIQHRPLRVSVAIDEVVATLAHRLQILIDVVGARGRVHPARPIIEALIDEELSPRYGAVVVQTLLTRHLHLGAEEKRSMRIDE